MSDHEYYAGREAQERKAAASAQSVEAKQVHNQLADRYADLAQNNGSEATPS